MGTEEMNKDSGSGFGKSRNLQLGRLMEERCYTRGTGYVLEE